MGEQTIIAIGREYGSGGHQIAEIIARDLGFKLYDRSMLDEIAIHMNVDTEVLEKYDEKPRNYMMSRKVGKYSNSIEEVLTEIQFKFIKKKAEEGESFVIVGRCADSVLRGTEGLITIFINGNRPCKIERVMKKYQLNEREAVAKMERHDKNRKRYHNRHSDFKWGDARFYDLCINSSHLKVEGTTRILEDYIQERIACNRQG